MKREPLNNSEAISKFLSPEEYTCRFCLANVKKADYLTHSLNHLSKTQTDLKNNLKKMGKKKNKINLEDISVFESLLDRVTL